MHDIDTVCRTPPGQSAVSLRGVSGVLHGFTAFPLREAPCGPAVYIYARQRSNPHRRLSSGWSLLRIGETGGARDRSDIRHTRFVEGRTLGATHILIHFCCRDADQRRLIFADLCGRRELRRGLQYFPPQAA